LGGGESDETYLSVSGFSENCLLRDALNFFLAKRHEEISPIKIFNPNPKKQHLKL